MKKYFYLLVFTSIFLTLSYCNGSTAKANPVPDAGPSWALNPPKDSTYYYFAGYADGLDPVKKIQDMAVNNAKAEIMAYIFEESTVNSVFETFGSLSDNKALQKNMKETVKSQSAARLSGVETEKTENKTVDDGGLKLNKVWVLVKIKKSAVQKERKRIINELKRKLELVEKNIREAQSALNDGRVIDAVRSYISAAISATKVKERKDEFPIYLNEAGNILANLSVESVGHVGKIDINKGGTLKFKILYAGKNGSIPVKGATLKFSIRDNRGEYNKKAISDSHGIVIAKIQRLNSVNNANMLYAKLYLPADELMNLGSAYQKYYSTLKTQADRVQASVQFVSISKANLNIPTAVIAIKESKGKFSKVPALTSKALSLLQNKGYKTRKFPDSVSLKAIYNISDKALRQLKARGIKRVFVLYVNADVNPKYQDTIKRYVGFYSVSSQLVDTSSGEILASKNLRLSGAASSKSATFDAFIQTAGRKLRNIIR